ncbi:MAG: hypothetical protein ABI594_08540 [Ginsengibacter sp.]
MLKKILYHPFFIKLFHWEYWPFHIVYAPVYFYWLWLGARSRSFFFFNAANPSIKNGGFLLESKNEIYKLMPSSFYPLTLFFKPGVALNSVLDQVYNTRMKFPLIGKPDIGMQGIAVKKLDNEKDLYEYISDSKVDFLVQEFVSWENEVGIFYYRFPAEENGTISGIVKKEFLTAKGNGISTMEELLKKEKRFILQLKALRHNNKEELQKVLPEDEEYILVPYGNHARGAKFIDASNLIEKKLIDAVDAVCKKIDGFYFGRLDVRYNTWEELKQGKNFSIIELNGAGSEPTHIYDPNHSIFFAWKEIIKHLNILSRISRINKKRQCIPYMKLSKGMQMFRENKSYVKMITTDFKQRA